MLNNKIKQLLDALEAEKKHFDDHGIAAEINKLLREEKEHSVEDVAESLAFGFIRQDHGFPPEKEFYYGPQFIGTKDDGTPFQAPDPNEVTVDIVKYWGARSAVAHPLMAVKYADLVVDFSQRVGGKRADYAIYQKVIDATLDIASQGMEDGLDIQLRLARALTLAAQMKDAARLEKLKQAIIETEKKYAEDDKPGLWGYSFEWLVLETPSGMDVTPAEIGALLAELERRLDVLVAGDEPKVWAAENAVKRLTRYYIQTKDEAAMKSVMGRWEAAYRKDKRANSDLFMKVNYLEHLHQVYDLLKSHFPFAKAESARLMTELSSLPQDIPSGMKEVSTTIDIPQDKVDQFMKSIFDDAPLDVVIGRIALLLTPTVASVKKQFDEIVQKHPLQYLMGTKIVSEHGYTIASLGTVSDDPDGRFRQHYSQNVSLGTFLLSLSMTELKKRFTPEEMFKEMEKSAIFTEQDQDFIKRILKAFWEDDYLVVSGLSIPLIEDAVRSLFRINGRNYLKPIPARGGFDVKSLHDLLTDVLIKDTFGRKGADVEMYLRILLTENVGWNLRNNLAHGLTKQIFGRYDTANQLMHAILLLSLIRKNPQS